MIGAGLGWALGWHAPAGPAAGDDPFSIFGGWDSGQLLWLAILVPVAVLVFSVGSRRVRSQLGPRAIVPQGRGRWLPGGDSIRRDADWRAAVDRLEARPPTPVAEAQTGLVRIQGVITGATGNLGGAAGRECVWRNRAGAGPKTAVAAELLFVADASGRCGIEELELARVVAPVDKVSMHSESTSLYVGDRIEVVGRFEREVLGEHEDPARLVYGTLGGDGRLDIHVLERPSAELEPASAKSEALESSAQQSPSLAQQSPSPAQPLEASMQPLESSAQQSPSPAQQSPSPEHSP